MCELFVDGGSLALAVSLLNERHVDRTDGLIEVTELNLRVGRCVESWLLVSRWRNERVITTWVEVLAFIGSDVHCCGIAAPMLSVCCMLHRGTPCCGISL